MNRYQRKPSVIILAVAALLGVTYVVAWGRVEQYLKQRNGNHTLESLEQKIANGDKTAETWIAYGQALAERKRYGNAADAYRQVLTVEPTRREAKFQRAVNLALAHRGDELHGFLRDLVHSEPKLAVDLFERPELQPFQSEPRFASLYSDARNEAVD